MPRFLALLLSVLILGVGVVTWIPLIHQKAVRKRDVLELQEQIHGKRATIREIESRIHAVRHDPAFVERLAREKFGLARPGETVFKFRNDPPTGVPQATSPDRTTP
ncbi:MAG: septum formation initiator family protein [Verrucomicrobiae bacterium]|nr:septum formation initiator family protein [Verrucomicrobiae bacterium]